MCSARPHNVRRIAANLDGMRIEAERQAQLRQADPLADHKARMEREHQATLRRNQRGLWILAAIVLAVVAIVAEVAGVLP